MSDNGRRYPQRSFEPDVLDVWLAGRHIAAVRPLTGGKVNSSYHVVVDDGSHVVLRLFNRGDPAQPARVMALAATRVPVPRQLARGPDWALYTLLPGAPLEMTRATCRLAAETLARIAAVELPAPGQITAEGAIVPFPFSGVAGYIAMQLANPAVRAWLSPRLIATLNDLQETHASRLAALDAESRLVHGDFNPTNLLVDNGVISGVLDWEFAHAGTPYMDIGNLVRRLPESWWPVVATGLSAGGLALPEDWTIRARLADLTAYLEWLDSPHRDDFKRTCVARLERLAAGLARSAGT